jgi:hypothetical protein
MMGKLKLTKELTDEICKYISQGVSKRSSAEAAGISEVSFYSYFNRGEKLLDAGKDEKNVFVYFYKQVKKAETFFKLSHLKNIKNAAEEDWRASAWMLERCFPEEYGRNRVEITGANGGAVEHSVDAEVKSAVQIYLPDNNRGRGKDTFDDLKV